MESKFSDNTEWRCCICMSWLQPGTKVCKLPCCASAIFCQPCYIDLANDPNNNKKCPNCQKERDFTVEIEKTVERKNICTSGSGKMFTSSFTNCLKCMVTPFVFIFFTLILAGEIVLNYLMIDKMAGEREYDYQSAFAIASNFVVYIILFIMIFTLFNFTERMCLGYGRYNGRNNINSDFFFNKRVKDYPGLNSPNYFQIVWHTPKIEEVKILVETGKNNGKYGTVLFVYFKTILLPKLLFTTIIAALHFSDNLNKIVDQDKQLWLITAANCISLAIHLLHDRIGGKICFWNSCFNEKDNKISEYKICCNGLFANVISIALFIIQIIMRTTMLAEAKRDVKTVVHFSFGISTIFNLFNNIIITYSLFCCCCEDNILSNYYPQKSIYYRYIQCAKLGALYPTLLSIVFSFLIAILFETGALTYIFGSGKEAYSMFFIDIVYISPLFLLLIRHLCYTSVESSKIKEDTIVVVPRYDHPYGEEKV